MISLGNLQSRNGQTYVVKLDRHNFITIVEKTPLVSIALCLVFENKILLGNRNNEPLKGQWFTPGGRIFKNESWQDCLRRILEAELGLNSNDAFKFKLMDVWDHFYPNSFFDQNVSTHYVSLPHYCFLKEQPTLIADGQHNNLSWFDLEKIKGNENFHEYMRSYASWLINMSNKND